MFLSLVTIPACYGMAAYFSKFLLRIESMDRVSSDYALVAKCMGYARPCFEDQLMDYISLETDYVYLSKDKRIAFCKKDKVKECIEGIDAPVNAIFETDETKINYIDFMMPSKEDIELIMLRNQLKHGYDKLDRGAPYKNLLTFSNLAFSINKAYHVFTKEGEGELELPAYPYVKTTTLQQLKPLAALKHTLFFEYVVFAFNDQAYLDFARLNKIHAHYDVVVTSSYLSCKASCLAKESTFKGLASLPRVWKEDCNDPFSDLEETPLPLTDDMAVTILMTIKEYDGALKLINKQISENGKKESVPNLYTKKISLGFLAGKDEKEISKELVVITSGSEDNELLVMLTVLATQLKNRAVQETVYNKVLEVAVKTSNVKLGDTPLKLLLQLQTLNNETLFTIIDYLKIAKEQKALQNEHLVYLVVYKNITHSPVIDDNLIQKFSELFTGSTIMNDIPGAFKIPGMLPEYIYFLVSRIDPYSPTVNQDREKFIKYFPLVIENTQTKYELKDVLKHPVQNFYYSYQGVPSVDIFKLKSAFFRKVCPDLLAVQWKEPETRNERIKILFHSNFLQRLHSVYKDRHQVIKQLSEDPRFDVYFSTFENLEDNIRYTFGSAKHIKLPKDLAKMRDIILGLNLDAMVFCEISMCPWSYFLAHMKLARVQYNTWGHSDTCGIDTIDYYVSSKLYEVDDPAEAQSHYSEKLILQNSLCTCYVDPMKSYKIERFKNRISFGFTNDTIIYFCAQSLFKFNPVFDDYLVQILKAVPNSVLIMLDAGRKDKILSRFNDKGVGSQIHFKSMMGHEQYLNLINLADVVLDPYPFGGCNSSMESFTLKKPVVTQPSQMINGRFTSGFYKKMNMSDMLCNSKEEYIDMAIKLGTDKELYSTVSKRIMDNVHVLFEDKETIDEWKQMIIDHQGMPA